MFPSCTYENILYHFGNIHQRVLEIKIITSLVKLFTPTESIYIYICSRMFQFRNSHMH